MSAAKEIRDLMGRCSRLEQQIAKLPTRIGNSAGGSGSGGIDIWIEASSYELLESPDTEKIAYISDGPQKGQIYRIGWDSEDEPYWKCIDETYEATTKAGLANNEYVQKFAVGRVESIYYRRNEDNDGWEAQNEFE